MASSKRYKKPSPGEAREPSRAEKESAEIELEILEFWNSMASSTIESWDKPWINALSHAENGGKYLLDGERYSYQGSFNRLLIARYTQYRSSHSAPIVFSRSDLQRIFDVTSFVETPIVKESIKSIGSLFKAPVSAKYFVDREGNVWKGGRPTPSDIDRNGLIEKASAKKFFGTFPIWSLADIYDLLPEDMKVKADALIELRAKRGYDYDPSAGIDHLIDRRIEDLSTRHSLQIIEGGNAAFYHKVQDTVTLPLKDQFKNPIARFAVAMHECAHSTMHVLGRTSGGSQRDYAIEEIVAETSAVMMVSRLLSEIKEAGQLTPELQEMFSDYYSNAMSYNHGWGEKFGFLDSLNAIKDVAVSDTGIVKSIILKVVKSVDSLQSMSITPEARTESILKHRDRSINRTEVCPGM